MRRAMSARTKSPRAAGGRRLRGGPPRESPRRARAAARDRLQRDRSPPAADRVRRRRAEFHSYAFILMLQALAQFRNRVAQAAFRGFTADAGGLGNVFDAH